METRKKMSFERSGTTAFPALVSYAFLTVCFFFFPAQYKGNTKDIYLWYK